MAANRFSLNEGSLVRRTVLHVVAFVLGTAMFLAIASLVLLAVPTALLSVAPDLATFAALRILQGLFMSSAFALMLSYLGEACTPQETAGAFAAYITGNVASNLIGRLLAAAVVDHAGLAANFYVFAALNLLGALLVSVSIGRAPPGRPEGAPMAGWALHLRNHALCTSFAIGFLILFAFIGTFTYVNFVLVRAPLGLGMMQLGLVYFVFMPSILTTPLAGHAARRWGTRPTLVGALATAGVGLPLLGITAIALQGGRYAARVIAADVDPVALVACALASAIAFYVARSTPPIFIPRSSIASCESSNASARSRRRCRPAGRRWRRRLRSTLCNATSPPTDRQAAENDVARTRVIRVAPSSTRNPEAARMIFEVRAPGHWQRGWLSP